MFSKSFQMRHAVLRWFECSFGFTASFFSGYGTYALFRAGPIDKLQDPLSLSGLISILVIALVSATTAIMIMLPPIRWKYFRNDPSLDR